MNWIRFLLAVVLSGFAATFTDWLFMGVLFHKKYLATPEIWRIKPGQNDTRSIVLSSLLGVLSCATFLYLCIWVGTSFVYHATPRWLSWSGWRRPYRSFLAISCGSKWIRYLVSLTRLVGWRVSPSPALSATGCSASENYKQTKSSTAIQSRIRIRCLWRTE
jgi:hypothetical protein